MLCIILENKLFSSKIDDSLETAEQLDSAHNSDQEVNRRSSETDDSFDTSELKIRARIQRIREELEKGNIDFENSLSQAEPKRYFCVDFILVNILKK